MGKLQWYVEKDFMHNGLRCVVVMTTVGHRCGYVGVPKNHPVYGKGYGDIDVDVHGGLTYICGSNNNYPVKTEDLFWFGFDCAHVGDGKDLKTAYKYGIISLQDYITLDRIDTMYPIEGQVARTTEYVTEQCILLAEQLSLVI